MAHSIRFSAPENVPAMSRAARRKRGVFYTPPELVALVLELTLQGSSRQRGGEELRALDPACGAGEFLAGAAEWLGARGIGATLWGVDVDPAAVEAARERLMARGTRLELIVGDALDRSLLAAESFDVVVGNPPYVSIRELTKSLGAERVARLRERYGTARGNFDLYAVFIERALELLKPGGRCGLVVPNKWATLDYARDCRELLLARTTIEHVVDLAGCKAFRQANVYPQVVVFRKSAPGMRHRVLFSTYEAPVGRGAGRGLADLTGGDRRHSPPCDDSAANSNQGKVLATDELSPA